MRVLPNGEGMMHVVVANISSMS